MGKILKFCSSCDEGFAEKFTFCPDCGAPLQAFEMNPVEQGTSAETIPDFRVVEPEAPAFIAEATPVFEEIGPISFDPAEPTPDEVAFASAPTEEIPAVIDEPFIEDEEVVTHIAPTAPVVEHKHAPAFMTPAGILFESEPKYADEVRHTIPAPILGKDEDGYTITVIEEKNGKQRNYLLLGAAVLMVSATLIAWGISLFQKALDVGAIGDDRSLALLIEDVPMPVDEIQEKKNKDDGGGGGGGGREDEIEENQGDLADQTKQPIRPPDAKIPKLDNPELVLPPPSTQGNQKFPKDFDRWGNPNKYGQVASNGLGTGGGLGSGDGTGQGSGRGTGAGSGTGSGYGNGVGNGNGSGRGDGDDGNAPPAPPARVTQPLKILAKQKAQYTDAARQNNVQGTVTLRVTFLASGGIGSISTIKGLPNGLTEQAIAAARNIRFEPEMVNGQPRTTTRPVSFTFNIY
jgi:TonB family protein